MCFVVQNHLGKGSRWRAPVASPRAWLFQGIEPIQSQENVSPFNHSQGRLRSPLHPIDMGAFCAPKTPDHFMETE
jgi:hypothetical protein